MARYRLYPTAAQEAVLREFCAQARYVWNLAWNMHQFGELETYGAASRRVDRDGREYIHQKRRPVRPLPGYVAQARMLTEARACGWIDKNSRDSQAKFCCTACGFTCNADENAAINIAAGHAGGTPRASVNL
jgi:hypothetical protein